MQMVQSSYNLPLIQGHGYDSRLVGMRSGRGVVGKTETRVPETSSKKIPQYRLGAVFFHYAPLLIPLFFAAMQQIMHAVEFYSKDKHSEAFFDTINWGAELLYALLTFWVWAMSSNIVSNRMLAVDPPDAEAPDIQWETYDRQRRNELASIVAGMLICVLAWGLCLIPTFRPYTMTATVPPLAFVLYVRRLPNEPL